MEFWVWHCNTSFVITCQWALFPTVDTPGKVETHVKSVQSIVTLTYVCQKLQIRYNCAACVRHIKVKAGSKINPLVLIRLSSRLRS